MEKIFVVNSVD